MERSIPVPRRSRAGETSPGQVGLAAAPREPRRSRPTEPGAPPSPAAAAPLPCRGWGLAPGGFSFLPPAALRIRQHAAPLPSAPAMPREGGRHRDPGGRERGGGGGAGRAARRRRRRAGAALGPRGPASARAGVNQRGRAAPSPGSAAPSPPPRSPGSFPALGTAPAPPARPRPCSPRLVP